MYIDPNVPSSLMIPIRAVWMFADRQYDMWGSFQCLGFKVFFPYRPGGSRIKTMSRGLLALAVPNGACWGNSGYVCLDRQWDDSVRRSQVVVGGLSIPVRHLHCLSDVYINATTHYCIHHQGEEEEESRRPDRARGPFFIFTEASRLPRILPGLVVPKCWLSAAIQN